MKWIYGLKIRLFFDSQNKAETVAKALKPELEMRKNWRRSALETKLNNSILSINVKAIDAVALRASINSLLKNISLCEKILEVF